MQNVEEKEEWNKKRIIIAICFASILLVGIAYFLKNAIFDDDRKLSSKAIQGAKTEKENTETQVGEAVSKDAFLPLKTSIKEKLDILKKEVANLNVEDIASSSSQIQKIINDFNSLKQYPVDEIKDICRQICGL